MFLLGRLDRSFVQHRLQSGDLVVMRVFDKGDGKRKAVATGRGKAGFMVFVPTS